MSVQQSRRWLGRFLELAQHADTELEKISLAPILRQFASSLAPRLLVDWGTDFGGAPPTKPLAIIKRKRGRRGKPARAQDSAIVNDQPDKDACIHCGRPAAWLNRQGQGFCPPHEAAARQQEAEDEIDDWLVPSLQAATATPAQDSAIVNDQPKQTDLPALFREILYGLKSFLNSSEWTFPPLKLVPTVTLGAEQEKPERFMMGTLRDVTLLGISDLLLENGHKIRRCAARDCNRAFLAIRRQTFCSPGCAARERFERFYKKLGDDGFRERRRQYYVRATHRDKGKARVIGRRRQKGRTQ